MLGYSVGLKKKFPQQNFLYHTGCVGVVQYYNPNIVLLAHCHPTSSSTHLYTCLCLFLLTIFYILYTTLWYLPLDNSIQGDILIQRLLSHTLI